MTSQADPAGRNPPRAGFPRSLRVSQLNDMNRLRGVLPPLFVMVTYLTIGMVAYQPTAERLSQHFLGANGDYTLAAWFFGWLPHALAHGQNPFLSNAIFAPTSVNLAQNTEGPLLGLAITPLTLAFGPVVSTNLLTILAMPASASAAFIVLRKWNIWLPAAALGGLFYGFSAYMIGQASDHPVFTFVPLPPFIALTLVSIFQQKGSPRKLGIQLGLLVVAQYLIQQEVLLTVAIMVFAAILLIALRNPATILQLIRVSLVPFGIALGIAFVILSYPVWMLIAGPQHSTGPLIPLPNPAHNDPLNFVIPGPLQKVSFGMGSIWYHLTPGAINPVEIGAYVGVPLLVLTGFLAWRSRRSPRMQLASVLLLVAAVFSLGSYLPINGRLTSIPLPFLLLDHTPLINNLLPSRMSFEVGACLAAVIAFGLDDMHRAPAHVDRDHGAPPKRIGQHGSWIFAGLTLLVLVVTQLPQWPYPDQPAPALPASLIAAIPKGDPVTITYPFDTGYEMQPMAWQLGEGYGFRIFGGYAHRTDARGHSSFAPMLMNPPELQRFLAFQDRLDPWGLPPPLGPNLVSITRVTLSKYHVRLVIVDRTFVGSGPVVQLFDQALGPPRVLAARFCLWTVKGNTNEPT